jgi:hypothetical protein
METGLNNNILFNSCRKRKGGRAVAEEKVKAQFDRCEDSVPPLNLHQHERMEDRF